MGTIPTFPTFTAGEIPTAAKLTSIKTAGDFWGLTPRAGVHSNTGQSIANNVYVLFTAWDGEAFDVVQSGDTEMHSTTTNPERVYIRTAGRYQISGQVTFEPNATGIRGLQVRLNSAGNVASGTTMYVTNQGTLSTGRTSVPIAPIIRPFVAGDYLEVFVTQNSGGALLTTTGAGFTFFQVKLDSA